MISVIFPTRKRPELLKKSIGSLLANRTRDVEILLYVDDDDTVPAEVTDIKEVRVISGPRLGWGKNHEYFNILAKESKGDWIMLWNDDFMMITPNWDVVIDGLDGNKVNALAFSDASNISPVISRAYYNIVGHMSLSAHADTWIQYASRGAGVELTIPMQMTHLRDSLNDETKKHSESFYATTSPEFYRDDIQNLIKVDIEKIKNGK